MTLINVIVSNRITRLFALFIGLFSMAICAASADNASWPRQVTDSKGTHTLQKPPQRIVSTSVSLTGALLAINAPVIASGATTPNNRISDDRGFLRQWSELAKQRHVQRLYIVELNLESVAAARPDLILVSGTGRDSALGYYDQLAAIAPTLVLRYDDKSWQQLLKQLGQITGQQQQATDRINQFNARLKDLCPGKTLQLPPQPVNVVVYTPATQTATLLTSYSAQGRLLEQLGFTLAVPETLYSRYSQQQRRDRLPLTGENLLLGLTGHSLLLAGGNSEDVQKLIQNPLLTHLPAIAQHRVWALGDETFRIDYYSANQLLDSISTLFCQ